MLNLVVCSSGILGKPGLFIQSTCRFCGANSLLNLSTKFRYRPEIAFPLKSYPVIDVPYVVEYKPYFGELRIDHLLKFCFQNKRKYIKRIDLYFI